MFFTALSLSSRLALRSFTPSLFNNAALRVLSNAPIRFGVPAATRMFSISRPVLEPAAAKRTTKAKASKKATPAKKKPVKKVATKKAPRARVVKKKPAKRPAKKAAKKAKKPAKPRTIKVRAADRPPRAPSGPFILFFRKYYEGADLSRVEDKRVEIRRLTAEAGRVWRSLSDHEKQAFRDEHKANFAEYEKKREEYYKNVDPAVLRELNKRQAKWNKRKFRVPSTLRLKKPATPYMLFLKDERTRLPPIVSLQDNVNFVREHAVKWNAMSEADKRPFVDQYEEARKAYIATKAA